MKMSTIQEITILDTGDNEKNNEMQALVNKNEPLSKKFKVNY